VPGRGARRLAAVAGVRAAGVLPAVARGAESRSGAGRERARVRLARPLDRPRPGSGRRSRRRDVRLSLRPAHVPGGAFAEGGTIEEGWLVARIDVRLPIEEPYGEEPRQGRVEAILTAADAESPLVRVASANAVAGRGLEGDRYHDGRGTFSGPGRGYQLTLVEAEVLEAIDLRWEQARRNVVTRGISLNALVGRHFKIGDVECVGRRLAEPYSHLERLARPGLLRPLVHRAGLRADIARGGVIAAGDLVSVVG
jgi:MOSC domain-containing protein YiiM